MYIDLRIPLYIGTVALAVSLVCFFIVGFANSASRNISLALGSVFGTLMLLAIQALFELRPLPKSTLKFRTEFTIDKAKPKMQQIRYSVRQGTFFSDESEANKFLLTKNAAAFQNDDEKLWRDMSLFSLIRYFFNEQHDWQIARDTFGTYERFQYLSQADRHDQCTKIEFTTIQIRLRQLNNLFADFDPRNSLLSYLCLPPGSKFFVEEDGIAISHPFVEIRFTIEPLWKSMHSFKPGTNGPDAPTLPSGEPRFQTREGIMQATVEFNWIRSQNRELPTFQNWANDVVERARNWFDPTPPEGNMYLGSDFS